MASSSDFARGRARVAVGPSSSSDISVVASVIIAGLTGAVEATSPEAVVEAEVVVEAEAVLGAVVASVTLLLVDALGVEVDLYWLQLF
jgi:hypothetical protein